MQGETFAYSGDQGETHDTRCPLFGGEVKRTCGDVCILNIATFFLFTMLTPFLFMVAMYVRSTPLRMLMLPWAGIAQSPSLKGKECQTYSRARMRLCARNLEQRLSGPRADGHEYYEPWMDVPGRYKREIQGPGRRYEVDWYNGKYQGELIVDHVVYVHVSRY
ncbi:hypothetical protein [Anaerobaca lacustris]|uniref:Uncharacterized protein n=1 Tax=Anaerobaca lacustris TaxID=3044600 RepID=A0AAW6U4C5_9BACT|nr:hypothetical protein [Sedimentisphaerales bacterium M17dextr]